MTNFYIQKTCNFQPLCFFLFFFYKQGMKLIVSTDPYLSNTEWIISTFIFLLCNFLKHYLYSWKWVLQKVFFFLQPLKLGVHLKKKIPTRYSATRRDPISKVTYLKRGHLCKRNLSSGVEMCKLFGVSLLTETQHCPWKREETNPTQ